MCKRKEYTRAGSGSLLIHHGIKHQELDFAAIFTVAAPSSGKIGSQGFVHF